MNANKVYSRVLVLPAFLLYTGLYILPCVMGIWYSLTNWNLMNFFNPRFIGLENYLTVFLTERNSYLNPIWNTILFALVTSLLEGAFGLGLALLLNDKLKTKEVLRGVFFIPGVMAPLIIGYVFSSVFHPTGIFNSGLRLVGLGAMTRSWLVDPLFAMPAVMFAEIWRYVGLNMVIFLAGIQTIPQSFYESAAIDGASPWKELLYITFPCIMPSVTITTVINIIHGLNVFDIIFSLTNGGPGNATEVLNTVVYREFSSGRYALSSTLGVVIILLTAVIALSFQSQLSKREVEGL